MWAFKYWVFWVRSFGLFMRMCYVECGCGAYGVVGVVYYIKGRVKKNEEEEVG